MSIQRFNDYILEFPQTSTQDLVDQQQYQQTCNWPIATSSSSTIIGCIGSPSSAFFATERCLGLTQYGNLDNTTSQLTNNYDLQISYDPQQCKSGILPDSTAQSEPDFHYVSPEGPYRQYPFPDVSEKERMLHLKNELLGEFDTSYQRHPSLPFDGNQDYCLSNDLCCSQLANMRQQSASPSLTCHHISASSGVSHQPIKTRIRWSEDLHDRFLECVNRLGGADKATPKQILNLMDSECLTLDHVKSHLQKYRNAKHPESAGKSEKRNSPDNAVTDTESKTGIEIKEALKMQVEVQRCLHEQLETQRTLQMRIEEQAKKLKMIFDQQQKTNRTLLETQNSNISSTGVEILVVEDSDNTSNTS
ncbi:protein PHOSPHATE STARVATION RESPONSE 1-like [Lycium barbarum]|uniref:protein PHOSPHATE STARVATION RESPONSE 1-like n=1 Tax=Lycium barbarum TaxID=112863 RepID=UPI00293E18D4|nr:protein PHOSPHATE STARVATION RESPONSE 1-like [Lycium barbarum]